MSFEDRSYYYFQYNAAVSLGYDAAVTTRAYNATTNVTTVSRSELKLRPFETFYNNSIIVGKHWSSGWSLETEWASYDIYFDEIDGEDARNSDYERTLVKLDYNMINLRKDLFSYGNFMFFTRVGVGFAIASQPHRNSGGTNKMEFAYQGALGTYYRVNNFLDLETSVNYFKNLATMKEISAIGTEYKLRVDAINLYLGARFKL